MDIVYVLTLVKVAMWWAVTVRLDGGVQVRSKASKMAAVYWRMRREGGERHRRGSENTMKGSGKRQMRTSVSLTWCMMRKDVASWNPPRKTYIPPPTWRHRPEQWCVRQHDWSDWNDREGRPEAAHLILDLQEVLAEGDFEEEDEALTKGVCRSC